MVITGTSVKKSTPSDKERIMELVKSDAHMYDNLKQREMYRILKEERVDIMLSGGRTQFVALKAKVRGSTSIRSGITPMPAMWGWFR